MGFVLLPADSPSPATERAHPSIKCPPEVASCSCTGGDGAKAVWCGDACGEVAAGVDGVVADMVAAVSCCVVGDAQHVATTTGQEQDRIDGMRLSGVKGNGKAQEATGPETLDVPLKITGIVLEWLGTDTLVHTRPCTCWCTRACEKGRRHMLANNIEILFARATHAHTLTITLNGQVVGG